MKPIYKRHRGDEWYDEVHVVTVPRYKTSELSGDEWRTSVKVSFWRKGQALSVYTFGDLRTALASLPGLPFYYGPADQGSERGKHREMENEDSYCMQPGCKNPAVSVYRLRKQYSGEGYEHIASYEIRRRFCQVHLSRGDCGLEDADANYEVVSGPGPAEARDWESFESPSSFGGIVELKEE